MLGYSQLIIARDESFEAILAVIPLEGGFCMVKKPRDQDVLILESTHRQYVLRFEALGECLKWYRVIQKVTCRELKVKKYLKRLQAQVEKLELENIQFMYQSTVLSIDEKLSELKELLHKKATVEYQYAD